MSSTLSDGLDPSELLYLRLGGGKVTGDRLPGFKGLVTGSTGTDSGLLRRGAEEAALVLLLFSVLERLGEINTEKNFLIRTILHEVTKHSRSMNVVFCFSFFVIVYIVTTLSDTAVAMRLTSAASHPRIIQPDYYTEKLS